MRMKTKWRCENVTPNDVFDNPDNRFVSRLVVWTHLHQQTAKETFLL